jgi:hypothetical protein
MVKKQVVTLTGGRSVDSWLFIAGRLPLSPSPDRIRPSGTRDGGCRHVSTLSGDDEGQVV